MNYQKGNWILTEHGEVQIKHVVFDNYQVAGEDGRTLWANKVEPILLTEEWLIEFGFEKTHPNGWVWSLKMPRNDATLQIWFGNDCMSICRSGIEAYNFECKYIHQLQNLYWCLRGKELEPK